MSQSLEAPQPRVLVIDDERGIRESVRFSLSFCDVLTAETVQEGLDILAGCTVDTIILDLNLPGMNGIEGLSRIRKIDSDVAVVILTAYGSLETAREAIRLGANDYQLKPFDVGKFTELVRHHVDRTIEVRQQRMQNNSRNVISGDAASGDVEDGDYLDLRDMGTQDLEAPLRAMNLQLRMLKHNLTHCASDPESLDEILHKKFSSLQQSLRLSWEMVRNWQETARGVKPDFDVVNLMDVVRDVHLLAQPECLKSRINIVVQACSDQLLVWGSRPLLLRAIYGLVKNVIHSGRLQGSVVKIACRTDESGVICSISEVNHKRSSEKLNRLFERYYANRQDGSSPGLYYARTIIDCHEGEISILTEEGSGVEFQIRLPVHHPASV